MVVNQNFDVNVGVINGSWGCLRAVRYSTDAAGHRHLNSCTVEVMEVKMPHLPPQHFQTLPDTTDVTYEHGASHKCCVIKRRQVQI